MVCFYVFATNCLQSHYPVCIDRCTPLPFNSIHLVLQEYRILHQSADRKYSRILTFEDRDCVKVYFCPLLPDVRNNIVCMKVGFALFSFWYKWYEDGYRHGALEERCWLGKQKYSEKPLYQCHFYHHKYLVNCPGSELVPPVMTNRCKCLCFCGGCYIVCYSEMETLCYEGTLS